MRILSLLNLDSFRFSIGSVFETLGHQVYHLNVIQEDILTEAIRTFRPDFAFTMGWDKELCDSHKRETLRIVLRRHNVYHVYFAEEDALHFERWSQPYVMQVQPNFVLSRDHGTCKEYRSMGIPSTYLDVGCNPIFHHPTDPRMQPVSVSLVANAQLEWDIFRRESIRNLTIPLLSQANDSPDFFVWGRGWSDAETHYNVTIAENALKGILPYAQTPDIYNSSHINLSVQSVKNQISNRTYDILSSGGFLLTSDTEGVRNKLKAGIHCETSASPDETMEKVDFYLKNETVRDRIRRAGCELAQEKFSYLKTIPTILSQIEFQIYTKRSANHP